jgi:AAA+ ATPase superfamily predicted ATPase
MEYKNTAAFINRQAEMKYLKNWIQQDPGQILFFYGPKSSGKTTLIYRFVQSFLNDEKRFSVKLFNLRKVLIVNYDDFLQRFFALEEPEEENSSLTRHYNLQVFKLTVQMQKKIKEKQMDPFDVMEAELKKLKSKGIKPIIIIDELQALDFIYFNSQRELIKELINFFVALTKESHLCHVLLSSSDGYFIEKLYNDSKLRKTAKLFEVDYLPENDIFYWLANIDKESNIRDYVLTQSQIEYIWKHFGGSIWEIYTLLGDFLKICENGRLEDQEMKRIVEQYMLQARSYFVEYAALDDSKTELLREINKYVHQKGCVEELDLKRLLKQGFYADKKALQAELHYLVRNNFLYYNPTLAMYKLQGKSMEIGLELFIRKVAD